MKKIVLILAIMYAAFQSAGQSFTDVLSVTLPDSVEHAWSGLVDLDNDGLQDVLVVALSKRGYHSLYFINGEAGIAPSLNANTVFANTLTGWVLFDYDADNLVDLVVSSPAKAGSNTVVYLNKGDFTFDEVSLNLPRFSLARFHDLDNDGNAECIISGTNADNTNFTRTYVRKNQFTWELAADTIPGLLSAVEVVDFNKDGNPDLLLSGRVDPDSVFTLVMIRDSEAFRTTERYAGQGRTILADVDGEGAMDVIVHGTNKHGDQFRMTYDHARGAQVTTQSDQRTVFFHIADLDNDGRPDENLMTVSTSSDTINFIRYATGSVETLRHKGWLSQRFGDFDQDGRLDFVQTTRSAGHVVVTVYRNVVATENNAPSAPFAWAVPVYDRVLLYWTTVTDDHTPVESITYDVFLQGVNLSQAAYFDFLNGNRLVSRHGNNGNTRFNLIRNAPQNFQYAIQSVDNALHGGPEGLCIGSNQSCVDASNEVVMACTNEPVSFQAPSEALWFSFRDGFLGKASSHEYEASSTDTLFYFIPSKTSCSILKTFEVEVDDALRDESFVRHVCASAPVQFSVDESWTTAVWSSANQGDLGTGHTLLYSTTSDDLLTVVFGNATGCEIRHEYQVKVSMPEVNIPVASFRITKGQSVQLNATGEGQYSWSPATGLSATNISNPVAAPVHDTEYTVTVYDSIGCTASGKVIVYVESTGYIATLFSPNNDGQNDALKVYGLTGVDDFSLRIYNREGSVVYQTNSLGDALQSGWDGTTNGKLQPNGVYFWRVTGAFSSGRTILLNGKQEGSLVLLR
jgi:gliding motility-associated-like protein